MDFILLICLNLSLGLTCFYILKKEIRKSWQMFDRIIKTLTKVDESIKSLDRALGGLIAEEKRDKDDLKFKFEDLKNRSQKLLEGLDGLKKNSKGITY